ncbi:MAG: hypothetical protein P8Y34_08585, partial [Anaerolineales bacterium]
MKPADVHKTIASHMLADGYPVVFDIKNSHDTYFVDQVTGREYIDFFTFFDSNALSYNHPRLTEPAFLEKLTLA